MCFSIVLPYAMVSAVIVRSKHGFIGHFVVAHQEERIDKLTRSFEKLERFLGKKIIEKSFHGTLNDLRSEIMLLNRANQLPGVRSRFSPDISTVENHVNLSVKAVTGDIAMQA